MFLYKAKIFSDQEKYFLLIVLAQQRAAQCLAFFQTPTDSSSKLYPEPSTFTGDWAKRGQLG
jgi:hypothetical protein